MHQWRERVTLPVEAGLCRFFGAAGIEIEENRAGGAEGHRPDHRPGGVEGGQRQQRADNRPDTETEGARQR